MYILYYYYIYIILLHAKYTILHVYGNKNCETYMKTMGNYIIIMAIQNLQ